MWPNSQETTSSNDRIWHITVRVFTLVLPTFVLRRLCDWGNGAGDVNVDVKDTCTAGCNDADGNLVGDDNDPDDGTTVTIEGVWADDKVIGVCKAETWYGTSLCELGAIAVWSSSLPRTKPAWLLAYSKIKKANKNCKKII